MRRGYTNLWKYDSSPREVCECGEVAFLTISENGATHHYCDDCAPTWIEREYERKFPAYEPPATDNEVSLARFLKLSGKSHKVATEVTRVSARTRREETYARLREKVRGNKWFDENA